MKIDIIKNDTGYFLAFIKSSALYDFISADNRIAELLDIKLKKYHNILISCGAFKNIYNNELYFKSEEDAERAIEKLEPYLVMATLTE